MAKARRSETISQLHASARLVRTALAAKLNGHGFHAGQDQVMLALFQEDGQTPGQLATRLGVKPPTITKTINRLSAQGHLEKRPSSEDQRQSNVFLTSGGRDTIRDIERAVKKTEKQALKGLDKKERRTLTKLLARIEENLTRAVPDDDEEADDATLLAPPAGDEDDDKLVQAEALLDQPSLAPSADAFDSRALHGDEMRPEEARAAD
jgi:DNA-binding MarR family transcriptional regulator